MNFDEWRETYSAGPLMNEAMARAAWNAAIAAEREACAEILDRNAQVCRSNSMLRDVLEGNAAAIRARSST